MIKFRWLEDDLKVLVENLVIFLNIEIAKSEVVEQIFAGTHWQNFDTPDLDTIHAIQAETRGWLLDLDKGYDVARWVMQGGLPFAGEVKSKGIRFNATPTIENAFDPENEYRDVMEVNWEIEETDLRSVCAFAVVLVYLNLHDRTGICEIDGCENIIIDQTSRGKKRRYCDSKICKSTVNKQRIQKHREKKEASK